MALTLTSTLTDLLAQLCVIDAAHTTEVPTITDFGQNGVQLNWLDGSNVRISVTTMSTTPDGVRHRETVDLTEVPGGFNPNNPLDPIASPSGGPLEGDIVPVQIPYVGPPAKNVALVGP